MASPHESYFAEATGWELDRSNALRTSARRAWIIAIAAVIVAALSTGAIAMLAPLKTVEPYVIRVDSSSGVVDVVPEYEGKSNLPESVVRQLAATYVTQRERFIPALAESDYEQVGAFQTSALNQAWSASWDRANPNSPLNLYGDNSRVLVQIHSISFLKQSEDGSAVIQVRFQRATQQGTAGQSQLENFVVTLSSAFGPPAKDVHRRTLNPLGFTVLEYRREPEVGDWRPSSTSTATGVHP